MVFIDEKSDRKRTLLPSIFDRNKAIREHKEDIEKQIIAIREELEEHLDTINANTSEMDFIHEHLSQIDSKLDKINERLDEIQMHTGMSDKPEFKQSEKISLTLREQEVFLALYTANHFQTYQAVCRRLGLSEEHVKKYIRNMIAKGIPIIEKHSKEELFVALDPIFKDLQAKEKVVMLNQSILNAFSSHS